MTPNTHRVVAVLSLLAFLCAGVGVVPTREWLGKVGIGFGAERYPCEHGRCGCSSAHECWTTCRCQTLEMKLAWAAR